MWPLLSGGQPVTVAMHDAPVKEVAWIPEMNLLVSGSWDKTLRYVINSNSFHLWNINLISISVSFIFVTFL